MKGRISDTADLIFPGALMFSKGTRSSRRDNRECSGLRGGR